jgi:hypothetical protein
LRKLARLEARSADTRASLPWISIIAEEAKARYFAAPLEHVGRNVIMK